MTSSSCLALSNSFTSHSWQEVADIVHSSPLIAPLGSGEWAKAVPVGKPASGPDVEQNSCSGAKTRDQLGVQYRTLQQTIEAAALSLEDYVKRQWKGLPSEEIFKLP